MNIIVNASALRSSGALSIYNQFITHLIHNVRGNNYYIFVDSKVNRPNISGVVYLIDNNHSWLHRIIWDSNGMAKWLRKNNIVPDVVVSLQNTGVKINCKQVIYYHQPLPLFDRKWNFFNHSERIMWLYNKFYSFFVKRTLTSRTEVVVQIPYIKKQFIKKFSFDPQKIQVLFPDVENIDIKRVKEEHFENQYIHFIYPATATPYKEHKTLCECLNLLKSCNSDIFNKIKIHLTIERGENIGFDKLVIKYGLSDRFVLEGRKRHSDLLSMYKASQCLLFPSVIETLGLPLLEAAAFGLPIIVADLDYAHEVLKDYEGAFYVESYNYQLWAKMIESVCMDIKYYKPLSQQGKSSWNSFFDLIEK